RRALSALSGTAALVLVLASLAAAAHATGAATLLPIGKRLLASVAARRTATRRGPPQLVVLDAVYTHAADTGPPPNEIGHRQAASGRLLDLGGRVVGTFAVTCRWVQILAHGDDADEHCRAEAATGEGHLSFAGPSRESAPTHTWSLTAASGRYAGATGTIIVRDVNPTETIAAMAITAREGTVLRVGVVDQPAADDAFRARANAICATTATTLARLPRFPFDNFDPLHPSATLLPKVGRFFAGPGNARPALRKLARQLTALGPPPAAKALWRRVLAAEHAALAVRDAQIQAALAGDATAFVASVHSVGRTAAAVALTATAFGVEACIL